jgi:hypothetical protein
MADGTLDSLFASAGVARVQLQQARFAPTTIRDLKPGPDNALTVAGDSGRWYPMPFVARLLGSGNSPGILSINPDHVIVTEASGEARVQVERIGGSHGAVSVSYLTRDTAGAVAGDDYVSATGQLHWTDGDTTPKEVVIPVLADAINEQAEAFELAIDSPQGGAGLGVYGSSVEIAGFSYPAGTISFAGYPGFVIEGSTIELVLGRTDYASGAVSVTVHIAGGSAEVGSDVASSPTTGTWSDVVVDWADGDSRLKTVTVAALKDHRQEDTETVNFELINPTGGALLGAQSKVITTIDDATPRDGGGSFGVLSALIAGLAGLLRGARRMHRRCGSSR